MTRPLRLEHGHSAAAEVEFQLVYVVKWDDVAFRGSGGPALSPGGRPTPRNVETQPVSHIGTQLGVIDARSGEHVVTMLSSTPIPWSQ